MSISKDPIGSLDLWLGNTVVDNSSVKDRKKETDRKLDEKTDRLNDNREEN